jgi:type II secretory pathway component PulJ
MQNRRGLTLIDTLAGVALIAIVLVGLFALLGNTTRNVREVEGIERIDRLAPSLWNCVRTHVQGSGALVGNVGLGSTGCLVG